MKTIVMIASSLLLFAGTQLCGCGSCAVAHETTTVDNSINDIKTVKLKITGMTCAGCSDHISKALKGVNGIKDYKVEYPGDKATISYDANLTSIDDIIKVIEQTGYKAEILKETKKA